MMNTEFDEVARLGAAVRNDLGDESRWFKPEGYQSVALCLIDSIYSTGNRYTGVVDAVKSYIKERESETADARTDSASDLLEAVERWGGDEQLAAVTKRWRCWASTDAPLKATAVVQAAHLLADAGLETVEDVRAALMDPEKQSTSPLKKRWLDLPGQRSGLTWTYFLMLAGVPGVKADRMVVRYVERALGRTVEAVEAAQLVSAVADERKLPRTLLDHAIWRQASGRPIFVEGDVPFDDPDMAPGPGAA